MAEMWEGWYCVGVMVLMFVMLLKNLAGPDILMLGALALMLAAGTVDMKDGLNGFSNKGAPRSSVSRPNFYRNPSVASLPMPPPHSLDS